MQKLYHKLNQIIFIIEVPIKHEKNYIYFQLFPLPTPQNYYFETTVPNSKYLILNEHENISTNTPWKSKYNNEILCEEEKPCSIEENPPCEFRLFKYDIKDTNYKTFSLMKNGARK